MGLFYLTFVPHKRRKPSVTVSVVMGESRGTHDRGAGVITLSEKYMAKRS